MKLVTRLIASTSILLPALLMPALAQQGIKRTVLSTIDFPPGYQTVKAIAEVAPNMCSGRHTHPGIESAYVLEGEFVLKVPGRPDKRLKAGDPIDNSANLPHDVCATASGVKVLAVYVVEKGKPLATPLP